LVLGLFIAADRMITTSSGSRPRAR
jgi:hypothetical protein